MNDKTANEKTISEYFAWDPQNDPDFSSLIVGEGSIGGKGRSLLFGFRKIRDSVDPDLQEHVTIPVSLFIAVSSFRDVIRQIPNLEELQNGDPAQLEEAFLRTTLPEEVRGRLAAFLSKMTDPIIVRSSSILEDSLKYSFAGKYLSLFEINGDAPLEERLARVEEDIKKIYARTFFPIATAYRNKHKLGNDEMGIIIMRVAGKWRGNYYYPTMAGVGFSRYYRRWTTRIKSEDGIIRLVFGMGTTSTKRGYARTFSLTMPCLRPEGQNPFNVMRHSQEHFQVVDKEKGELVTVDIKQIWKDIAPYHECFPDYAQIYRSDDEGGYFSPMASRIGSIVEKGDKICFTFEEFACRSKHFFERMKKILQLLDHAMGVPADVEFAYHPREDIVEIVQARPLWLSDTFDKRIPDLSDKKVILQADRMVTNGARENIPHIVLIDHHLYSRERRFSDIARGIGEVNQSMGDKNFILVAPGRVGSSNPLLGVPVQYDEITKCCCIVEVGIPKEGYMPELSFGTHFFTDLEIDGILYMPVYKGDRNNIYDEEFFETAPYALGPHPAIRIYTGSFSVYTDGDHNRGIVIVNSVTKPV